MRHHSIRPAILGIAALVGGAFAGVHGRTPAALARPAATALTRFYTISLASYDAYSAGRAVSAATTSRLVSRREQRDLFLL